ncbi:DUF2735 domain-containing protein [Enterovirga sp.]|uniref:DUF2735 domain-containing protein n=1 Tax=Enterovirga sp. TaxID=2026350 RepID=UPI002CD71BC8|nr:DUF2735 domain-containing protein [Enterovirga sp.]HMO31267.1 DUF2735 domain-containing protein [Enterovirga sp.]
MALGMNTATAKIYQFPVRRRSGAAVAQGTAQVVELRPAAPQIVWGAGSSYHEAAIAEEARARKA